MGTTDSRRADAAHHGKMEHMSSKIQWTDEVWNPVTGCTKISAGCAHCYAEVAAKRFWGERKFTDVQCHKDRLDQPLRWRKPRRVFVNSMSDLFHEDVPSIFVDRVFAIMALSPKHTFQVLTKRPSLMHGYLKNLTIKRLAEAAPIMEFRAEGLFVDITVEEHLEQVMNNVPILLNVWLGVSVEDQKTANERIPILLDTPAALRFVSAEPLLGPVDLRDSVGFDSYHGNIPGQCVNIDGETWHNPTEKCRTCGWGYPNDPDRPGEVPGIDWVIVGGESGPGARPCDVAWIRSIVGQCHGTSTPCFVKQLGANYVDELNAIGGHQARAPEEYGSIVNLKDRKGGNPDEWPEDLRVREWPVTEEAGQ